MTGSLPAIAVGIALIALARWASRRRGSRRDELIALRFGDVLLTEVVGAFLVGYGIGELIAPPDAGFARPGAPVARGGLTALRLPVLLGLVGAAIAVFTRFDLRDLFVHGRAARNALRSYVGWDGIVVAAIPASGFGEITMRDGMGNLMSVAATADVDIAVGTHVRVVGTRELNVVVAPLPR